MPFVEGETLRARLEREGQLPVADVRLRFPSPNANVAVRTALRLP
jgi:hypothetical protein